jgi:hypothetical protein
MRYEKDLNLMAMTVLDHVVHLHHHGYREVYHIEDPSIQDRFYFLAINSKAKDCRLVQIGPENRWYSSNVDFLKSEDRLNEFREIEKRGGYKIQKWYDAVNLFSGPPRELEIPDNNEEESE